MLRTGEELRNRLRAGNIALFGISAPAGGASPVRGAGGVHAGGDVKEITTWNRSSPGTVVTRSGGVLIAAALVILAIGLITSG